MSRHAGFTPDPHWKIFNTGLEYEACFVFDEDDSPVDAGVTFRDLESTVKFASGTPFPIRFDEKVWQEGSRGGRVLADEYRSKHD